MPVLRKRVRLPVQNLHRVSDGKYIATAAELIADP